MNPAGTLVLGAGPAGLAFAWKYGAGAIVLEKAREPGGLSRSIELEDGVFDLGGHSFHTPHAEVLELVRDVMGNNWHEQPRDARVWVAGQLIPYPFQRHFDQLENPGIVADCAGHQADAQAVARSRDFEEWIVHRFGEGVARHFMLPYNRKLWARDLRKIDCEWVGERVATGHAASNASKPPATDPSAMPARKPLQADSRVAYPLQGGFGEIFHALAARCHRIELGEEVVHIDLKQRKLITRSGKCHSWRNLVSTMPLPELLACLSECPEQLIEAASRLQTVSLKVLLILARLRDDNVPQRVYIADHAVPPHKIAFNHTSSPGLRQRVHHAISCEVSYSPDKPAGSDEALLDRTISWLVDNRYIESENDIRTRRVIDIPYGYPVYCHARKSILADIMAFLNAHDIYSIGRFGAWDYANSDECMRQGLRLAERLSAT